MLLTLRLSENDAFSNKTAILPGYSYGILRQGEIHSVIRVGDIMSHDNEQIVIEAKNLQKASFILDEAIFQVGKEEIPVQITGSYKNKDWDLDYEKRLVQRYHLISKKLA